MKKFVILTFKVRFRVEEMSDYVRKGIKIPKSFDEAQRVIDGIQQQYKKMVFICIGFIDGSICDFLSSYCNAKLHLNLLISQCLTYRWELQVLCKKGKA